MIPTPVIPSRLLFTVVLAAVIVAVVSVCTVVVVVVVVVAAVAVVVHAFCLPSIDMSLQLPGLVDVVSGFVSKGYKLADCRLLNFADRIDNIQLILGSESMHCIPEKEVIFGKLNDSIYSDTSLGILLKGDINKLKSNLRFLKPCSSIKSNAQHMLKAVNVLPTGNKVNISVDSSALNDLETSHTYELFDDDEQIIESDLNRATNECLELSCKYYIGEDRGQYHEDNVELNHRLVEYALVETYRTVDGRLVKRRVTSLIPLISSDHNYYDEKTVSSCDGVRSRHKAAIDSLTKTKAALSQEDSCI